MSARPDSIHPPNRLAGEQSPYLLQHARNPVQWWPWGADAIAHARARGVPLLVSVGYSTCYWCHVMERESFESVIVAEQLNRAFVPVKVDREQRPDIDELLMTACQVFTQLTQGRASGGWPLNCFLDPDSLEPFFCGTYFPPQSAYGRPGFLELLRGIEGAWRGDRAGLVAQAHELATLVRRQMEGTPGATGPRGADAASGGSATGSSAAASSEASAAASALASEGLAQQVVDALMSLSDPTNGGFGGAPKFPTPAYARFLFQTRPANAGIEAHLRKTLDHMALGGIFDQVGGGFHRYAVDATWTVPHFEKMLYDNGQLSALYALAAERWGDPLHAEVARRTGHYVLREMRGEHGRFLSAQDAEVDAREGGNYLWTPAQVRDALEGSQLGALWPLAARLYGLEDAPNFQDPHHPQEPPSFVLRLQERPELTARALGIEFAAFQTQRAQVDAALLAVRARRPQPITDDKTIAAWSGLMAQGLAEAGRVLKEPAFVEAAAQGTQFVLERMRSADGGLLRTWRAGIGAVDAFLEDYAHLATGALALWRATGTQQWQSHARALVEQACERFLDADSGAFFDTRPAQPDLFARVRSLDDGAVPSGTGAILQAMAELGSAMQDHALLARAARAIGAIAPAVAEQPVGASGTVLAARALAAAGALGTSTASTMPEWMSMRGDVARVDTTRVDTTRVDATPASAPGCGPLGCSPPPSS